MSGAREVRMKNPGLKVMGSGACAPGARQEPRHRKALSGELQAVVPGPSFFLGTQCPLLPQYAKAVKSEGWPDTLGPDPAVSVSQRSGSQCVELAGPREFRRPVGKLKAQEGDDRALPSS